MDCNQLERLVAGRSLDGLTTSQRERVEAHLVECAACRERWDAACQSAALHTATKPDRDPAHICDSVMARIRGDAEGSAGNRAEGGRPLPEQIGGFEVLGVIARGGMGTVLKARQISMDRLVALKILPPRVADDESFVNRFIREAHAAAKLRHPHIVQGYDAGLADGYYYFAMEYVDGEGLDAIVAREGPLEPERALRIMQQVCGALWAAHKAGIIHRDIKPSNLMLDSQGEVRVTDFGLAKRTEGDVPAEAQAPEEPRGDLPPAQSQALGTPAYVAPEVAQGRPADPRSDLYSLGATFFHLLAGRAPFQGPDLADVLQKQIHEQPPALADAAPRVDPRLCAVIDRLLRKDPEERFPSAQAVLAELDAFGHLRSEKELVRAEGRALIQDAPTMPLSAGRRLEREAALETQRSWWVMSRRRAALIATAVAALCMLVIWLWPRHSERPTGARRVEVRPPSPPSAPAVDLREQRAADLFRDAGDLALMMQWVDAEALIKRLDEGYSDTEFYKDQIVPIGKLRARINAALQTPAVKPPPVEAKPIKLPEKPGEWVSLFDSKTLNGWRVAEGGEFEGHGPVQVEANRIVVAGGRNRSGIAWMGDFPTVDYEVTLEARREAGTELVEILFPVGPTQCGWTVAGWGGTFTGLAMLEGHGGLDNDTRKAVNCRTGQWYRARLRVTREKIEGWLDDAKYIDLPRAGRRLSHPYWLPLSEPFALTTWRSTLAVRNIRLKLLERQPEEAPADAAKVDTASVAVAARGEWFDTGLFLTKGETYEFTATGRWAAHTSWDDGPAGAPRKQNHSYPLIGPRVFDLIAHVGEEGGPFHVGERLKLTTQRTGRLYLRMNDDGIPDNWGSLRVRIHGPLRAVEGAPLIARFTETVAELKIGPADGWVPSGISLRRGDRVLISAEGTWIDGPRGEPIDANGYRQTWRKERAGALIGRIGQHGALFTAARLHLLEAPEPGKLYLAINEVQQPRRPRGVLEDLLGVPPDQVLLPREGGDPAPRVRGAITVTIRAPDGFGEQPRHPDESPDLHCRLLATLRGHRSEVTCVDFSPDGAWIASGSRDTTLRLWDAMTGKCLKTLGAHRGPVEDVTFSPDGKQLISASVDRTVRLWDAAAGQPLRVLAGHTDAVRSVVFLSDGKRVASTGQDRSARVWDATRGEGLLTLQADSASWCVAVPPGGKDVAVLNERGWIRIWDAGLGKLKRVVFARSGRCRCLAYSSDGKRIASAGDRPYLHVWDAATGKCLGSVDLEGGIRSLVFSPDGRYLATSSARGAVRLWDAATLEHLRSLQGHEAEVRDVAFSPDGRRLATASFDGTIRLWALERSTPPDPEPGPDEAAEVPLLKRPAVDAPGPEPADAGPADDLED